MATFTIKRSEWDRAANPEQRFTYLCHPMDGKKCCLGFYALAMGFHENQIKEQVIRPKGWSGDGNTPLPGLYPRTRGALDNSEIPEVAGAWAFARVNDNLELSEEEREAKLTAMFAACGHTVTFED